VKRGDLVKIDDIRAPDGFILGLVLVTGFDDIESANPFSDWVEVMAPGFECEPFFLTQCHPVSYPDGV